MCLTVFISGSEGGADLPTARLTDAVTGAEAEFISLGGPVGMFLLRSDGSLERHWRLALSGPAVVSLRLESGNGGVL